jgi:endonuclease/exonuclease/phosphatase family metal-dependent hydrolase
MRLISLNAWGGRLIEPLMAYVRTCDADILCLQEVTHAIGPSPDRLIYRGDGGELPQEADLHTAIGRALPGHRGQFCPAMQGDLFDAAGRAHPSMFGLSTFVRDGLQMVAQVQRFVHGEFRSGGWGKPPVPRNIHCLRLYLPQAGRTLTVAHLHGIRLPQGKHDTPERQGQAARIVETVAQVRADEEPMILCGDLNLMPQSATFDLLEEIGLSDLVTARGYSGTRTSYYAKEPRYADYLLISPGIAVTRFEVVREPEVSDHCALLLEFEPA